MVETGSGGGQGRSAAEVWGWSLTPLPDSGFALEGSSPKGGGRVPVVPTGVVGRRQKRTIGPVFEIRTQAKPGRVCEG